jgi:hypothetical protein
LKVLLDFTTDFDWISASSSNQSDITDTTETSTLSSTTENPVEDNDVTPDSEIEDCIEIDDDFKNYVVLPKKPVNGILHLARDKPAIFSVYYDKSTAPSIEWFLNLTLIPDNVDPNKEEVLEYCVKDKHATDTWFFCNGKPIKLGESAKIPLLGQKRCRDISLRFPCNSSCISQFKKSKLQITIIDANGAICFEKTFNIRISERPGRDERELVEKISPEELM